MENKVFSTLNAVNVNKHTEEKNGLTYLSWAWAWGEVKKAYPTANYKVYETADGVIYWSDKRTAWVKVGVTIEGLEHIEYLPVMDYRNAAIPVEKLTSFDVNKAIQRALTKAIARHGLGLYIYAGEDLPEVEVKEPAKPQVPQTRHTAEVDALKALAEKKKKEYHQEPEGAEWPSGNNAEKPTQNTISGKIVKYCPLDGNKPHWVLVDGIGYATYHEGIGKLLKEYNGKLVHITYHDVQGKDRINHMIDEVKKP